MTIYRLYEQNGNRAGFWVQHKSWGNACARVWSIGGQDHGPLPGAPPRHEGAPVAVTVFDIRSGRRITEPAAAADGATDPAASRPFQCDPADARFALVAEPFWHSQRRTHGDDKFPPPAVALTTLTPSMIPTPAPAGR